jgi:hypothetical protein
MNIPQLFRKLPYICKILRSQNGDDPLGAQLPPSSFAKFCSRLPSRHKAGSRPFEQSSLSSSRVVNTSAFQVLGDLVRPIANQREAMNFERADFSLA